MITSIDQRDPAIAEQIYQVQQAAYTIERDLIEYPDFPPLRVTRADIQQEPDRFLGYWEGTRLAGVLSFTLSPEVLDIGRLIVHPEFFRRGIARTLLEEVERQATPPMRLTVSTAEKNYPAVQLYLKHGYSLSRRTTLPDGLVLVRFSKAIGEQ